MVPKIRDVNNKDLSTISKELRKISKACKELKIDKGIFWWINDDFIFRWD